MHLWRHSRFVSICILALAGAALSVAAEEKWTELFTDGLEAWKDPAKEWIAAGDAGLNAKNPRLLESKPGRSVFVNGPKGRVKNLVTKEKYRDVEVHVEFMIPQGSNSGVKFEGLYEIQIRDSAKDKELHGDSCGGIYPRAEAKPKYHHIDDGIAPRVNACLPPGQWQTLDAIFIAPRFDDKGAKTANARLIKAVLNGQVIHENVELKTPTGAAWVDKEVPAGPLLLQADHGPVAFRNVRIRPYTAAP